MQPGNNLSLSFIGANRNAERSPDKQNNAIQENEVLACNSCNFVGKNRKSIAVHWVWFPDCKKGEYTKKNAVHVKAEPELKKQASNSALYRCDVCNFETKYSQNLTGHFKSLKHIANAGPEPEIPEDELKNPESDLDGRIKELDLSIADSLSPKYRCETCNFTTKYSSNLTAHFKTQKHISNCEESNEEVIDDYNDFNDDYHCHVCQFKTRFVKSWISHVNSRLHKDAIKQNEDENEDLEDDDIDEKRAITYKIAKNKGLTPKRSKLQRNPRVKNRMKYTKALKRRKGAVREVREQTSKYGGEASGINMRVKKGVKFN